MALPTSGPLSLQNIAGEFGGSTPHSLSEYYGASPSLPTSGAISVNQFYGLANELVLYDAGNEYTGTTGGWTQTRTTYSNVGNASLTKNATNMRHYVYCDGAAVFVYTNTYTNSSITVPAGMSQLKATISASVPLAGGTRTFGVRSAASAGGVSGVNYSSTGTTTLTVNVSAGQTFRPHFMMYGGQRHSTDTYIYKVWLE